LGGEERGGGGGLRELLRAMVAAPIPLGASRQEAEGRGELVFKHVQQPVHCGVTKRPILFMKEALHISAPCHHTMDCVALGSGSWLLLLQEVGVLVS
jgi:hypothetical protein